MAATDRETPSICPECESGVHVACRDEPGTSAECACPCGEAPSAATKREPLLKWLRSPCDAPNWLFIVLSLLLVIVSLFDLTGVGK